MKLLYVGGQPCTREVLGAFLDQEEVSVTKCRDLVQAIVEDNLKGPFYCIILQDRVVLTKEIELLSAFLCAPAKLSVVLLEKAENVKPSLMLVSDIEQAQEGFHILLRRISKLSTLSALHRIDTRDALIYEYRCSCTT